MKQSRYLEIAKRLASLPKEKQQLFREKLTEQGINSWQLPIVPVDTNNQNEAPISLAQQRFLVAEQMSTRALYNLCSVLRFDQGLNISALEKAVSALIERHQILRTRYRMDDKGDWTAELMSDVNLSFTPTAVSFTTEEEQNTWYQQEYERQLAEPFDLGAGLPLRIQLYQASLDQTKTHYWVFFTIHHVAFDAWSSQQLNQELTILYSAALKTERKELSNVLAPLPVQYSDFSRWQSDWREGDDFQRQCDYWQKQLKGAPSHLALPFDRTRKLDHKRTYDGAIERLELGEGLSNSINKAVSQSNSTLYIYLQTAFSWLLSHYSQQTDFCFGSSIANRSRDELRPLVGPLLNTLVLRHKLEGNPSFEESLDRTQRLVAGAFDHQDLPFEQVQTLLKQSNTLMDESDHPASGLFQVMFVHVALPASQTIELAGTQVEIMEPEQSHARFDLTLRVVEPIETANSDNTDLRHKGLRLELEYSRELFDKETIQSLLSHLRHILEHTLVSSHMRLADVVFPSGLSQQKGTSLTVPAQLINTRFAQWSQSKRIALDTGEQQIPYSELNQVVTGLACTLQEQGIQKGDAVAILMPREARQIASLLACWRIGAVALMLDPRQPEQRLQTLLHDAEVRVLIQDSSNKKSELQQNASSDCSAVEYFSLEVADWKSLSHQFRDGQYVEKEASKEPEKALQPPVVNAEDTAYILYTSGSTGKPKGVRVSHGAMAHYAAALSEALAVEMESKASSQISSQTSSQQPEQNERWLTLATVAADLGLTSVFGALYQGHTLLLPDAELAFDPPALAEFLVQHPADYLKIVPSHLRGLLSVSSPSDILPKKALISGGEGMDETLYQQLKSLAPDMAIFNHYGPSEATVGVSFGKLESEDSFTGLSSVASLGRALPESILEVRSQEGVLLPQGVAGELWIASPQLANGYHGLPELTEQAFVTLPPTSSGQRYYRTGDRVRLNHYGVFEYLGRLDDQVKRRGYRLELGEVSAWLQAQPEVKQASVLIKQDNERSLLIGTIVVNEKRDVEVLLTRMKAALPDYMVPDKLIPLETIPLSANGKVDRKGVLALVNDYFENLRTADVNDVALEGAMTANETLLASLWCQLLNRDSVTPEDDFYALGGDSILSLQLIGLARQQGATLSPLEVMKHRTLKAMAACLPEIESNNSSANKNERLDPVAERLRDLYREVLGQAELDHTADFYQCGGDSILSLQLIARARAMDIALSPKLLAEHKTPQALARIINEDSVTASDRANVKASDVKASDVKANKPNLIRVDRDQYHPLSEAQKRIWFMQQMVPESSAWNVMQRLSVKPAHGGKLDLDALNTACNAMNQQHEMLRTQFVSKDDQVMLRVLTMDEVAQTAPAPLTVHHVTRSELEEAVKEKQSRVFDLESGQLWSLDVFCLSDGSRDETTDLAIYEYQLLLNIHHIATDGWSMALLVKSFLNFYLRAQEGKTLSISTSEPTYIDWVAQQSNSGNGSADLYEGYWEERLRGMPQTLTLPTDFAYPELQTDQGARLEAEIPSELIAQLDERASAIGVTPFQLLFAAWKLLLWRYSGQHDFAVGVPVSGRDNPETQNMVGVFINTLACRSQIDAAQSLNDWLKVTAQETLKDLSKPIALEQLLECIQPERDMARPALFQTLFNYQADIKGERNIALSGMSIEALPQTEVSTKSELSLNLFRQNALSIQFEYNRDLFAERTIEQMLVDYQSLVSLFTKSGELGALRVHEIVLPSMQQKKARGSVYPIRAEDDFIRRFEAQVEDTPEAWALHASDRSLTYKELNQEANRLAHWLSNQIHHVSNSIEGNEPLVAFCLPRTSQLLITLLAIQKAGAAYVPLDPKQPSSRLALIAERSSARMCLCDSSTTSVLENLNSADSGTSKIKAVNLEAIIGELALLDDANTGIRTDGSALAYTLYTSGSTGVPKGVQLERRQFANFLRAMERVLPSFHNVLALTTITFDIAGLELCLPLVNGAAVILADEEARRDGEQIGRLIADYGIDLVQATPSGWRLLEGLPKGVLSNVTALAGGEALDSELATQLRDQCRQLVNVYGPTETTVWSSSYEVADLSLPLTPIGSPLLNNHCYVLDAQLTPVPQGVIGELFIAGDGVARGYQGRPDLTAERFLPDPFGTGGRLYRTGDLVKCLPDGVLYFVGRTDQQVKLRGFRIELGEIEAALLSSPLIAQAAVTIEQERLIAWCVSDTNALSDIAQQVQAHLMALLPDYMLPQGYEWLKDLPLNASGKVDRNALSAHGVSAKSSSANEIDKDVSNLAQTLTKEERLVSEIWSTLLKQDGLNKHSHFFHLGGHSLMATQVRSRLREQGYEVSLRTIFETPVLSDLALYLSQLAGGNKDINIQVVERTQRMPLSDAQRRVWFMQQLKPNDTSFNMSSLVELESETEGGVDVSAIEHALKAVTARHEILRVTYHADERGDGYQKVNSALNPAFQLIDLTNQRLFMSDDIDAKLKHLIEEAANAPFDLTGESPLRLHLYRVTETRWFIQLVQHHIASDGWSMALLVNDLITAYQNFRDDTDTQLPPLSIQYLDYAAWQATDQVRAQQQAGLEYWRRHLVGMPEQLALPFDKSRHIEANDEGDAIDLIIPEALTTALNQFANERGCSLFMLLMAAYTAQLHMETGSQDIVMGTDVANRDHGATEPLIGFFVNLMALRMKPNGTQSFSDYLQQVRQVCLEGFDHQDIPFDRVVEAVQPARIQGSHPLIQALFVMQNTPSAPRELEGLRVTPHINVQQHSKFDMALFASEETNANGGAGKSQLTLRWVYRTALFEKTTMEGLGQGLLALLDQIVSTPDSSLLALKRSALKTPKKKMSLKRKNVETSSANRHATATSQHHALTSKAEDFSTMETTLAGNSKEEYQHKSQEASHAKPSAKRKLGKLSKMKKAKAATSESTAKSSQTLVDVRPLNADSPFPLIVECKEAGLDPKAWTEANRDQIMAWLETHGGILFRGFSLPTPVEFESFCQGIYPELYGQYGDLPKKEVGEKIYQSTPYPNDQMIMFHNESSHQHRWPRRQWFYCEIAAESGGCTPIVDCRALYERLPAAVRQKLQQKQLKYVRNFSGLDVSWQHFFKTEDRSEVEAICRDGKIDFEWYGEDKLRISQICPAVIRHPITGAMSFFNQIQLHHYSFLEQDIREHFLAVGGEENLPRNVYYGDGEPLEQEVVDLISELYEACAVRFEWQHGDVVMVDNMLAAHARDPFEGKRKMAVAMGDIYRREQLEDLNTESKSGDSSQKNVPTATESKMEESL